jgi:hypothetical protein
MTFCFHTRVLVMRPWFQRVYWQGSFDLLGRGIQAFCIPQKPATRRWKRHFILPSILHPICIVEKAAPRVNPKKQGRSAFFHGGKGEKERAGGRPGSAPPARGRCWREKKGQRGGVSSNGIVAFLMSFLSLSSLSSLLSLLPLLPQPSPPPPPSPPSLLRSYMAHGHLWLLVAPVFSCGSACFRRGWGHKKIGRNVFKAFRPGCVYSPSRGRIQCVWCLSETAPGLVWDHRRLGFASGPVRGSIPDPFR